MGDKPTRRRFIQVSSAAVLAGLAGCAGDDGEMTEQTEESMDDESIDTETDESMDTETDDEMMSATTTFTVRVENVAATDYYDDMSSTNGAIWVTPGAYAVHSGSNPVFTAGESASTGLEAQAEAGPPTGFDGEDGLVTELSESMEVAHAGAFTPDDTVEDPNDPTGEVPGAPPIAPDGAFEFEIEAESGQRLSFASMFVPSNDLFLSPGEDGLALFNDDTPVEGQLTGIELWDAGTEPNQQPGMGEDQAPAQDSPDQGDDEAGVVRALSEVDDGYDYPDASDVHEITVTPQ